MNMINICIIEDFKGQNLFEKTRQTCENKEIKRNSINCVETRQGT